MIQCCCQDDLFLRHRSDGEPVRNGSGRGYECHIDLIIVEVFPRQKRIVNSRPTGPLARTRCDAFVFDTIIAVRQGGDAPQRMSPVWSTYAMST